jgi:hypothetical protein
MYLQTTRSLLRNISTTKRRPNNDRVHLFRRFSATHQPARPFGDASCCTVPSVFTIVSASSAISLNEYLPCQSINLYGTIG